MAARWTEHDIPDQTGRVAVVTGANTGLGLTTAAALAASGAHVVIAVRGEEKGQAALERIRHNTPTADLALQPLDLSSLGSVRAAAASLRATYDRIDLLVNNAGVMYTPLARTAEGFELQLGTNHLGHFALTGLLLDRLLAAPAARVVTVSSVGHRIRADIHFDDLQWERRYNRVEAYGQAKLSNLMFTYALQRRLAAAGSRAMAVAAHPGAAATELGRNSPAPLRLLLRKLDPLLQRPEMGSLPTLRAAVDPTVEGGQYYGPSGLGEVRGHPVLVRSSHRSHDLSAQERLWTVSEDLTGVRFAFVHDGVERTRCVAPASNA
jgi:NAD(P)-dependent dehydrogenase (short-subunit alcohol dehydrogenase family)